MILRIATNNMQKTSFEHRQSLFLLSAWKHLHYISFNHSIVNTDDGTKKVMYERTTVDNATALYIRLFFSSLSFLFLEHVKCQTSFDTLKTKPRFAKGNITTD